MINFTTPTLGMKVKGVDLTGQKVLVTLEQDFNKLTKSGEDLSVSVTTVDAKPVTRIDFPLTQEESARFSFDESVKTQVNWISPTGVRGATNIKTIPVMENLLNKVINYDD